MAVRPSKTGLILIGASEFPALDGHDRKSFLRSYREITDYFTSTKGLMLPAEHVCDLFNSEKHAPQQIDEAQKFVEKGRDITDWFIFVITHGLDPKQNDSPSSCLLRVRNSLEALDSSSGQAPGVRIPRIDTHIDFSYLFSAICAAGPNRRFFFIVDACYSGAIHAESSDELAPINAQSGSYSDYPGRTIITSNSRRKLGVVSAQDQDILTQFSECLLDLLKNGTSEGFGNGLSINTLCYLINRKCSAKVMNLEIPASNEAEVSDRIDRQGEGLISDILIFPNNHSKYQARNAYRSEVQRIVNDLENIRVKLADVEQDLRDERKRVLNWSRKKMPLTGNSKTPSGC